MNSISWFIYIAQVSGSLGALFCVLGVGLMFMVMIRFAFPHVKNGMELNKPGDRDYLQPYPIKRGFMALAVTFLVIGNLMPGRNTMYAIAAAQVGEQVAKTELASDATKALQLWIKRQIEPARSKSNDH